MERLRKSSLIHLFILPENSDIYGHMHLQTTVFSRIYTIFPFIPLKSELCTALSFITVQYGALGSLNCSSQTGPNSPNAKE